jgi:hypothetical protein
MYVYDRQFFSWISRSKEFIIAFFVRSTLTLACSQLRPLGGAVDQDTIELYEFHYWELRWNCLLIKIWRFNSDQKLSSVTGLAVDFALRSYIGNFRPLDVVVFINSSGHTPKKHVLGPKGSFKLVLSFLGHFVRPEREPPNPIKL